MNLPASMMKKFLELKKSFLELTLIIEYPNARYKELKIWTLKLATLKKLFIPL